MEEKTLSEKGSVEKLEKGIKLAIKLAIKLYPHKHGEELALEIIEYLDNNIFRRSE